MFINMLCLWGEPSRRRRRRGKQRNWMECRDFSMTTMTMIDEWLCSPARSLRPICRHNNNNDYGYCGGAAEKENESFGAAHLGYCVMKEEKAELRECVLRVVVDGRVKMVKRKTRTMMMMLMMMIVKRTLQKSCLLVARKKNSSCVIALCSVRIVAPSSAVLYGAWF